MNDKLVIRGQSLKIIELDEVLYFSIDHRIVTAHCIDGNYEFYSSMKELTEQLSPTVFIRISRACVVSSRYIREVKQNMVILKNGDVLEIPRRNVAEIRDWILAGDMAMPEEDQ